MSKPMIRENKLTPSNLRNFTYSVDVKDLAKDQGRNSPFRLHSKSYFKKNNKIKPNAVFTFSKNVSQKNMQVKRKLSSGIHVRGNHHSVSLDQHLLKQKYELIKQMFEQQRYDRVIQQSKHILNHFQYSTSQQNIYYWLAVSLAQSKRYEQACEEMCECIQLYPNFQEGLIFLGQLNLKLKNYKQAFLNFEEAIKINNKSVFAYLCLLQGYRQLGENSKCLGLCKIVLEKFPNNCEVLLILIEASYSLNEIEQIQPYFKRAEEGSSRKDSLFLYTKGFYQKCLGNQNEAYILFDEALKFNNHKLAVNKALLETLKIEINKRDFYKAHHTISRCKFFEIENNEQMGLYSIFIEGVMTMMKKKYEEAIQLLLKVLHHKRIEKLFISSLVYKYLGYGYFKLGDYAKSIKSYQKIASVDQDESSKYNRLLAEGIQLVDKNHNFNEGVAKFNAAKLVYPQKVQPYIYIAMTSIKRFNIKKDNDEVKQAQALIQALKSLEQGHKLNSSSSNLLYHRTIIHLYFEDWQQAHNDINRCIEKAEQNLPKYFYLRGVCYSCIKQFKKAINQYSICISLDSSYSLAYLEKSKCNFLLGNTQKGFASLKIFMQMNPNDLSIYKWIGDLLYEGLSYRDAIKAYNQLGEINDFDVNIMKIKCIFRVGTMNEISNLLKLMENNQNHDKQKLNVDLVAFSLLNALLKNENGKNVSLMIKKINKSLEENIIGYIFQLIDCMNLLGLASFYLQKYNDAYQSFLLVLELYQSLCEKSTITLKSQSSEEELDLRAEDIYFNIIICEIAQGNIKEAVRMLNQEFIILVNDGKKKKTYQKLLRYLEKESSSEVIQLENKNDKPINHKLRKVQITVKNHKFKLKPSFSLYHDYSSDLYASSVAQRMVGQLHAGYIDRMPEGPWIKRNTHGVIFTQDVIPSDHSISFGDTARHSESKLESQSLCSQFLEEEKKTISKKQQFLKKLKFDEAVEAKLNQMIQRNNKADFTKKTQA